MKKINKLNGVNTLMNDDNAAQCKIVPPTPIQRQVENSTGIQQYSVEIDFVHQNCNENCAFFKMVRSLDGTMHELTLLCTRDNSAPHYFIPIE